MRRLLTIGAVLALVLAATASAAFFSQTTTPSNSFTANSSFCVSPGNSTVNSDRDTFYQEDKNPAGSGTTSPVDVQPNNNKLRRSYFRFTLPTLPHNCFVSSVTMTLTAAAGVTGRTIDVAAATGTIVEVDKDPWASQPGFSGTAIGQASVATGGTITWTLTSLVPSSYSAGATSGFAVYDNAEGTGTGLQSFNTREAGSGKPSLNVVWG